MTDKQDKNIPIEQPGSDRELERRVDAMMSVERQFEPPSSVRQRAMATDPDEDPTSGAGGPAWASMVVSKPRFGERIGDFMKGWWRNRPVRYLTLLALLAIIGAALSYPSTRYYMLNTAGVRSGASLTIVDNATQLPLKNVIIEVGTRKARTNRDGFVKLSGLALGPQPLSVRQSGFATINQTITLGLGSNPLGDYRLEAVGMQFRINVVDYLSGEPMSAATADSNQSNAQADDNGRVVLTIEPDETDVRSAVVTAPGYRNETLSLDPVKSHNLTVRMVSVRKHVYVSKQSSRLDVYKSYIDGTGKQLLLAGTGNEDAAVTLVRSNDGRQAALVSKRTTLKNQDGYTLQALTLINIDKETSITLEQAEGLQIIGWNNDRLLYVRTKAGSSAGSSDRQQLISYNYNANARIQLASANNFRGIILNGNMLYYAASSNHQEGVSQFVRIRSDNTGKQVIMDKAEIWNLVRNDYSSIYLATPQSGYAYKFGDTSLKTTDRETADEPGRFYLESDDAKRAVWLDNRDGKGVLLLHDIASNKDKTLASIAGLTLPAGWLDDRTVVFRISRPGETADYAVSLDGGEPRKISDVTASAGFSPYTY